MRRIANADKYVIGETAYHHEGDVAYLRRMVDDMAEIGLDAVKLHLLLDAASYMQRRHPLAAKLAEWMFDASQWADIIDHARWRGLEVIALCDDVESILWVHNEFSGKVGAIEIHATSLNDWFLLTEAATFCGPVILGVGGSTLDEIAYAVNVLREGGHEEVILMYGFQSYPTNYADINLARMAALRDLFGLPVGYADHTAFNDPNNEIISVMAAMTGFGILEKHYTPDYGVERIDYHAAVGRQQMVRIMELMDLAVTVRGSRGAGLSGPEKAYGNVGPMKKAIVARTGIARGRKVRLEDLWFKRTAEESTVRQSQLFQLIGLEAAVDIAADEIVDFGKVKYTFRVPDTSSMTHVRETKEGRK
jgi:sialic acid synthase SpsE